MKILSIRPERKHLSGVEFSEEYLPKGAKTNAQGLLLLDSDYIEEAKINGGSDNITVIVIDPFDVEVNRC